LKDKASQLGERLDRHVKEDFGSTEHHKIIKEYNAAQATWKKYKKEHGPDLTTEDLQPEKIQSGVKVS